MTKRKFEIMMIVTLIICILFNFMMNNVSSLVRNIINLGLIDFLLLLIYQNAELVTGLDSDNGKVKFLKRFILITIALMIIIIIVVNMEFFTSMSAKDQDIIAAVLVSLFIMIFGNYAPKLPRTRYVGYRLPWTIRDEDTWRFCHRLLGYLAFPTGIINLLLIFTTKNTAFLPYSVIAFALIPGVASLIYYLKKTGV